MSGMWSLPRTSSPRRGCRLARCHCLTRHRLFSLLLLVSLLLSDTLAVYAAIAEATTTTTTAAFSSSPTPFPSTNAHGSTSAGAQKEARRNGEHGVPRDILHDRANARRDLRDHERSLVEGYYPTLRELIWELTVSRKKEQRTIARQRRRRARQLERRRQAQAAMGSAAGKGDEGRTIEGEEALLVRVPTPRLAWVDCLHLLPIYPIEEALHHLMHDPDDDTFLALFYAPDLFPQYNYVQWMEMMVRTSVALEAGFHEHQLRRESPGPAVTSLDGDEDEDEGEGEAGEQADPSAEGDGGRTRGTQRRRRRYGSYFHHKCPLLNGEANIRHFSSLLSRDERALLGEQRVHIGLVDAFYPPRNFSATNFTYTGMDSYHTDLDIHVFLSDDDDEDSDGDEEHENVTEGSDGRASDAEDKSSNHASLTAAVNMADDEAGEGVCGPVGDGNASSLGSSEGSCLSSERVGRATETPSATMTSSAVARREKGMPREVAHRGPRSPLRFEEEEEKKDDSRVAGDGGDSSTDRSEWSAIREVRAATGGAGDEDRDVERRFPSQGDSHHASVRGHPRAGFNDDGDADSEVTDGDSSLLTDEGARRQIRQQAYSTVEVLDSLNRLYTDQRNAMMRVLAWEATLISPIKASTSIHHFRRVVSWGKQDEDAELRSLTQEDTAHPVSSSSSSSSGHSALLRQHQHLHHHHHHPQDGKRQPSGSAVVGGKVGKRARVAYERAWQVTEEYMRRARLDDGVLENRRGSPPRSPRRALGRLPPSCPAPSSPQHGVGPSENVGDGVDREEEEEEERYSIRNLEREGVQQMSYRMIADLIGEGGVGAERRVTRLVEEILRGDRQGNIAPPWRRRQGLLSSAKSSGGDEGDHDDDDDADDDDDGGESVAAHREELLRRMRPYIEHIQNLWHHLFEIFLEQDESMFTPLFSTTPTTTLKTLENMYGRLRDAEHRIVSKVFAPKQINKYRLHPNVTAMLRDTYSSEFFTDLPTVPPFYEGDAPTAAGDGALEGSLARSKGNEEAAARDTDAHLTSSCSPPDGNHRERSGQRTQHHARGTVGRARSRGHGDGDGGHEQDTDTMVYSPEKGLARHKVHASAYRHRFSGTPLPPSAERSRDGWTTRGDAADSVDDNDEGEREEAPSSSSSSTSTSTGERQPFHPSPLSSSPPDSRYYYDGDVTAGVAPPLRSRPASAMPQSTAEGSLLHENPPVLLFPRFQGSRPIFLAQTLLRYVWRHRFNNSEVANHKGYCAPATQAPREPGTPATRAGQVNSTCAHVRRRIWATRGKYLFEGPDLSHYPFLAKDMEDNPFTRVAVSVLALDSVIEGPSSPRLVLELLLEQAALAAEPGELEKRRHREQLYIWERQVWEEARIRVAKGQRERMTEGAVARTLVEAPAPPPPPPPHGSNAAATAHADGSLAAAAAAAAVDSTKQQPGGDEAAQRRREGIIQLLRASIQAERKPDRGSEEEEEGRNSVGASPVSGGDATSSSAVNAPRDRASILVDEEMFFEHDDSIQLDPQRFAEYAPLALHFFLRMPAAAVEREMIVPLRTKTEALRRRLQFAIVSDAIRFGNVTAMMDPASTAAQRGPTALSLWYRFDKTASRQAIDPHAEREHEKEEEGGSPRSGDGARPTLPAFQNLGGGTSAPAPPSSPSPLPLYSTGSGINWRNMLDNDAKVAWNFLLHHRPRAPRTLFGLLPWNYFTIVRNQLVGVAGQDGHDDERERGGAGSAAGASEEAKEGLSPTGDAARLSESTWSAVRTRLEALATRSSASRAEGSASYLAHGDDMYNIIDQDLSALALTEEERAIEQMLPIRVRTRLMIMHLFYNETAEALYRVHPANWRRIRLLRRLYRTMELARQARVVLLTATEEDYNALYMDGLMSEGLRRHRILQELKFYRATDQQLRARSRTLSTSPHQPGPTPPPSSASPPSATAGTTEEVGKNGNAAAPSACASATLPSLAGAPAEGSCPQTRGAQGSSCPRTSPPIPPPPSPSPPPLPTGGEHEAAAAAAALATDNADRLGTLFPELLATPRTATHDELPAAAAAARSATENLLRAMEKVENGMNRGVAWVNRKFPISHAARTMPATNLYSPDGDSEVTTAAGLAGAATDTVRWQQHHVQREPSPTGASERDDPSLLARSSEPAGGHVAPPPLSSSLPASPPPASHPVNQHGTGDGKGNPISGRRAPTPRDGVTDSPEAAAADPGTSPSPTTQSRKEEQLLWGGHEEVAERLRRLEDHRRQLALGRRRRRHHHHHGGRTSHHPSDSVRPASSFSTQATEEGGPGTEGESEEPVKLLHSPHSSSSSSSAGASSKVPDRAPLHKESGEGHGQPELPQSAPRAEDLLARDDTEEDSLSGDDGDDDSVAAGEEEAGEKDDHAKGESITEDQKRMFRATTLRKRREFLARLAEVDHELDMEFLDFD